MRKKRAKVLIGGREVTVALVPKSACKCPADLRRLGVHASGCPCCGAIVYDDAKKTRGKKRRRPVRRTRPIKRGDYFLLPFAGKRRDLLVRAERPHRLTGHWTVSTARGRTTLVLLSSCRRCPPSEVRRIMRSRK